jgi:DNA-directed RNA polymerase specialized sigma24 family protein
MKTESVDEFLSRGGGIRNFREGIKGAAQPKPKETIVIPPLGAACNDCKSYRNGKGSRKCISCESYQAWHSEHALISKIHIEIIPDSLLENIAEDKPNQALEAMKRLPDDICAAVCLRYYGNLSLQSIAANQRTSVRTIQRRINIGIQWMKTAVL